MKSIKINRFYPYDIDKVWAALTDPAALSEWLMSAENFKLVKGQQFTFKTKPSAGFDGIVNCKILDLDAPNTISYHWQATKMKNPTTVVWTLKQIEDGTVLQLEHSGFEGIGGRIVRYILSNGWKKLLSKVLPNYLESQES